MVLPRLTAMMTSSEGPSFQSCHGPPQPQVHHWF